MTRPLNIKTKLMGKGLEVSTILLGRDEILKLSRERHRKLDLVFETMVFHRSTGGASWDTKTYATEEDARAGHRAAVAKWKTKSRKEVRDELATRRQAESS